MPVVVVGGSGRGVGKTALVCGLMTALREYAWTAVKITSHAHGTREPVWEERGAGQETDTARYLAAGARRALLVTAKDTELAIRLAELRVGLDPGAGVIFESNRVLGSVHPDVCIAVVGSAEPKPSFAGILACADAVVARAHTEIGVQGKAVFRLAALDQVSPQMLHWLRQRLKHE